MWGGAVLASLALGAGAMVAYGRPPVWPVAMMGWLTAVANAAAACVLARKAVGTRGTAFLIWGIGGNCLRVVLLLAILCAFVFRFKAVRGPFLLTFFVGIFTLIPIEIVELFRYQRGRKQQG
jgi:hypothetical protein